MIYLVDVVWWNLFNRTSGGVSILVNENIPQSIVKLNTNLQAVAVSHSSQKCNSMFSLVTSS